MEKLLYGIIILLVFTSCNLEVKKQSFTIDYLKLNKWLNMKGGIQSIIEFSDSEMIGFQDSIHKGSILLTLEQKSDSLIAVILGGTEIKSFIAMKSLDILSFGFPPPHPSIGGPVRLKN